MLVTIEEYRRYTGDLTTSAATVSARLEEAVFLVNEYLERILENDTYTETLEVWYEDGVGYVYPVNTPITSVPVDATYAVDHGERRLRGVTADTISMLTWPAYTTTSSDLAPYGRARPDYATVTYDGGYTSTTCPQTLKRYIALCARGLMRFTPSTIVGAQEVSVGDVRVKYASIRGGLDALVPGMSVGLRSYKRKRVRF